MVSATPPTPTDVTASVTGALEFTITWTAPDPIDGVIGYEVYTREASTQFFPTKHVVSGASTNYLRLSGLLKGGRYFYQVVSRSSAGNSAGSSAQVIQAVDVPSAPMSPALRVAGSLSLELSWESPTDTGSGDSAYSAELTGYMLELDIDDSFASDEKVQVTVGVSEELHIFSGLRKGALYYTRVRAINDAGSGVVSDVVSVVSIDVPSRPRGLFATPVAVLEGFNMRFSWISPSDFGLQEPAAADERLAGHDLQFLVDDEAAKTVTITSDLDVDSSPSWTDSGILEVGTVVKARVAARNAAGRGPWFPFDGYVRTVVVELSGPPRSVTAEPLAPATIQLEWSSPLNSGVGDGVYHPIEAWKIEYSLSSSVDVDVQSQRISGNSSSAVIDDLEIGNSYVFRVLAINEAGEGSFSPYVTEFVVGTPSVPRSIEVRAVDARALRVSWSRPLDTGSGDSAYPELDEGASSFVEGHFLSYMVETSSDVAFNNSILNVTDGDFNFFDVMDLTKGSFYFVRVYATNPVGMSNASNVVTSRVYDVPSAPLNVKASVSGDKELIIVWESPSDRGFGAGMSEPNLTYVVRANLANGSYVSDYIVGDVSDLVVQGLQVGSVFRFSVQAVNLVGAGEFSESSAEIVVVGLPAAPSSLALSYHSSSAFLVTWSFEGVADYLEIEYSVSSNFFLSSRSIVSVNQTSLVVDDLLVGIRYFVRVLAVNAAGSQVSGFKSQVALASPAAPSIQGVAVAGPLEVKVTWELPDDFGGGEQYIVELISCRVDFSLHSTFVEFNSSLVSADFTFVHIDQFSAGVEYYFRVVCLNVVPEDGKYSSIVSFSPMNIPSAPEEVAVSVHSSRKLVVNVMRPVESGGVNVELDFVVEVSNTSSFSGNVATYRFRDSPVILISNDTAGEVVAGAANGSVQLIVGPLPTRVVCGSGLCPNILYWRVRVENEAGLGPLYLTPTGSDNLFAKVWELPGSVDELVAYSNTTLAVNLQWKAPANTGGGCWDSICYGDEYPLLSFKVFFRAVGDSSFSFVDSNVTNATVSGLSKNVEYEFFVSAVNVAGEGPSVSVMASAIVPTLGDVVITFTSNVTGSVSDVTFSFDVSSVLPSSGSIEFIFPNSQSSSLGVFESSLGALNNVTVEGRSVSVPYTLTTLLESGSVVSMSFSGVMHPGVSGTSYFSIFTRDARGEIVDEALDVAGPSLEPGQLVVDVGLSSVVAGTVSDVFVNFSLINRLPPAGAVFVHLPIGVVWNSNTTLVSNVDFSAVAVDFRSNTLVVKCYRSALSSILEQDSRIELLIHRAVLPPLSGHIGHVSVETLTNLQRTIDASGVASNIVLVPGALVNCQISLADRGLGGTGEVSVRAVVSNFLPQNFSVVVTFPKGFSTGESVSASAGGNSTAVSGVQVFIVNQAISVRVSLMSSLSLTSGASFSLFLTGIVNPVRVVTDFSNEVGPFVVVTETFSIVDRAVITSLDLDAESIQMKVVNEDYLFAGTRDVVSLSCVLKNNIFGSDVLLVIVPLSFGIHESGVNISVGDYTALVQFNKSMGDGSVILTMNPPLDVLPGDKIVFDIHVSVPRQSGFKGSWSIKIQSEIGLVVGVASSDVVVVMPGQFPYLSLSFIGEGHKYSQTIDRASPAVAGMSGSLYANFSLSNDLLPTDSLLMNFSWDVVDGDPLGAWGNASLYVDCSPSFAVCPVASTGFVASRGSDFATLQFDGPSYSAVQSGTLLLIHVPGITLPRAAGGIDTHRLDVFTRELGGRIDDCRPFLGCSFAGIYVQPGNLPLLNISFESNTQNFVGRVRVTWSILNPLPRDGAVELNLPIEFEFSDVSVELQGLSGDFNVLVGNSSSRSLIVSRAGNASVMYGINQTGHPVVLQFVVDGVKNPSSELVGPVTLLTRNADGSTIDSGTVLTPQFEYGLVSDVKLRIFGPEFSGATTLFGAAFSIASDLDFGATRSFIVEFPDLYDLSVVESTTTLVFDSSSCSASPEGCEVVDMSASGSSLTLQRSNESIFRAAPLNVAFNVTVQLPFVSTRSLNGSMTNGRSFKISVFDVGINKAQDMSEDVAGPPIAPSELDASVTFSDKPRTESLMNMSFMLRPAHVLPAEWYFMIILPDGFNCSGCIIESPGLSVAATSFSGDSLSVEALFVGSESVGLTGNVGVEVMNVRTNGLSGEALDMLIQTASVRRFVFESTVVQSPVLLPRVGTLKDLSIDAIEPVRTGAFIDLNVSFMLDQFLPSDARVTVIFPPAFGLSLAVAEEMTGIVSTESLSLEIDGQVMTIYVSSVGATPPGTFLGFSLSGIQAPLTEGVSTSFLVRTSGGETTEQHIDSAHHPGITIVPNIFVQARVLPSMLFTKTLVSLVVNLTLANPLPRDGSLVLDLPSLFSVSNPPVVNLFGISGTFSTALSGQVSSGMSVSISRRGDGSHVPSGGSLSFVVKNVLTPVVPGSTNFYTLRTVSGLDMNVTSVEGGATVLHGGRKMEENRQVHDNFLTVASFDCSVSLDGDDRSGNLASLRVAATTSSTIPIGGHFIITVPYLLSVDDDRLVVSDLLSGNDFPFTYVEGFDSAVRADSNRIMIFLNNSQAIAASHQFLFVLQPLRNALSSGSSGSFQCRTAGAAPFMHPIDYDADAGSIFIRPSLMNVSVHAASTLRVGVIVNLSISLETANVIRDEDVLRLGLPGFDLRYSNVVVEAPSVSAVNTYFGGVNISLTGDGVSGSKISVRLLDVICPQNSGTVSVLAQSVSQRGAVIDDGVVRLFVNPGTLSVNTTTLSRSVVDHFVDYMVNFTSLALEPVDSLQLIFPEGCSVENISSVTIFTSAAAVDVAVQILNKSEIQLSIGEQFVSGTRMAIVVRDVRNPAFVPSSTAMIVVKTLSSSALVLEEGADGFPAITAGTFSNMSVHLSSLRVGDYVIARCTFSVNVGLTQGSFRLAFPAGFQASDVAARAKIDNINFTHFSVVDRTVEVFAPTIVEPAQIVTIEIENLRIPRVGGSTGSLEVSSVTNDERIVEVSELSGFDLTPGRISNVSVASSSITAGSFSNITLSFVLSNPLPFNGALYVQFPEGFHIFPANDPVEIRSSDGVLVDGAFVFVNLSALNERGLLMQRLAVEGCNTCHLAPFTVEFDVYVKLPARSGDLGLSDRVYIASGIRKGSTLEIIDEVEMALPLQLTPGVLSVQSFLCSSEIAGAVSAVEVNVSGANVLEGSGYFRLKLSHGMRIALDAFNVSGDVNMGTTNESDEIFVPLPAGEVEGLTLRVDGIIAPPTSGLASGFELATLNSDKFVVDKTVYPPVCTFSPGPLSVLTADLVSDAAGGLTVLLLSFGIANEIPVNGSITIFSNGTSFFLSFSKVSVSMSIMECNVNESACSASSQSHIVSLTSFERNATFRTLSHLSEGSRLHVNLTDVLKPESSGVLDALYVVTRDDTGRLVDVGVISGLRIMPGRFEDMSCEVAVPEAGAVSDYALSITLANPLPKMGKLQVMFEDRFVVKFAQLTDLNYGVLDWTCVYSNDRSLTLHRSGSGDAVASGSRLALTIRNIRNADKSVNHSLLVRTLSGKGTVIDSGMVSPLFVKPGRLSRVVVSSSSNLVREYAVFSVEFVTANLLSLDGECRIKFPDGFSLGEAGVEGGAALLEIDSESLMIRVNLSSEFSSASLISFSLVDIQNPGRAGDIGQMTIYTYDSGFVVDSAVFRLPFIDPGFVYRPTVSIDDVGVGRVSVVTVDAYVESIPRGGGFMVQFPDDFGLTYAQIINFSTSGIFVDDVVSIVKTDELTVSVMNISSLHSGGGNVSVSVKNVINPNHSGWAGNFSFSTVSAGGGTIQFAYTDPFEVSDHKIAPITLVAGHLEDISLTWTDPSVGAVSSVTITTRVINAVPINGAVFLSLPEQFTLLSIAAEVVEGGVTASLRTRVVSSNITLYVTRSLRAGSQLRIYVDHVINPGFVVSGAIVFLKTLDHLERIIDVGQSVLPTMVPAGFDAAFVSSVHVIGAVTDLQVGFNPSMKVERGASFIMNFSCNISLQYSKAALMVDGVSEYLNMSENDKTGNNAGDCSTVIHRGQGDVLHCDARVVLTVFNVSFPKLPSVDVFTLTLCDAQGRIVQQSQGLQLNISARPLADFNFEVGSPAPGLVSSVSFVVVPSISFPPSAYVDVDVSNVLIGDSGPVDSSCGTVCSCQFWNGSIRCSLLPGSSGISQGASLAVQVFGLHTVNKSTESFVTVSVSTQQGSLVEYGQAPVSIGIATFKSINVYNLDGDSNIKYGAIVRLGVSFIASMSFAADTLVRVRIAEGLIASSVEVRFFNKGVNQYLKADVISTSGDTVTVKGFSASRNTSVVLRILSVQMPTVAGPSTLYLTALHPGGAIIQYGSVQFILSPQDIECEVSSDLSFAGALSSMQFSLSLLSDIYSDGYISIKFPRGFDVHGASVLGNVAGKMTLPVCSSVANETMVVSVANGFAQENFVLKVLGINGPSVSGWTGSISVAVLSGSYEMMACAPLSLQLSANELFAVTMKPTSSVAGARYDLEVSFKLSNPLFPSSVIVLELPVGSNLFAIPYVEHELHSLEDSRYKWVISTDVSVPTNVDPLNSSGIKLMLRRVSSVDSPVDTPVILGGSLVKLVLHDGLIHPSFSGRVYFSVSTFTADSVSPVDWSGPIAVSIATKNIFVRGSLDVLNVSSASSLSLTFGVTNPSFGGAKAILVLPRGMKANAMQNTTVSYNSKSRVILGTWEACTIESSTCRPSSWCLGCGSHEVGFDGGCWCGPGVTDQSKCSHVSCFPCNTGNGSLCGGDNVVVKASFQDAAFGEVGNYTFEGISTINSYESVGALGLFIQSNVSGAFRTVDSGVDVLRLSHGHVEVLGLNVSSLYGGSIADLNVSLRIDCPVEFLDVFLAFPSSFDVSQSRIVGGPGVARTNASNKNAVGARITCQESSNVVSLKVLQLVLGRRSGGVNRVSVEVRSIFGSVNSVGEINLPDLLPGRLRVSAEFSPPVAGATSAVRLSMHVPNRLGSDDDIHVVFPSTFTLSNIFVVPVGGLDGALDGVVVNSTLRVGRRLGSQIEAASNVVMDVHGVKIQPFSGPARIGVQIFSSSVLTDEGTNVSNVEPSTILKPVAVLTSFVIGDRTNVTIAFRTSNPLPPLSIVTFTLVDFNVDHVNAYGFERPLPISYESGGSVAIQLPPEEIVSGRNIKIVLQLVNLDMPGFIDSIGVETRKDSLEVVDRGSVSILRRRARGSLSSFSASVSDAHAGSSAGVVSLNFTVSNPIPHLGGVNITLPSGGKVGEEFLININGRDVVECGGDCVDSCGVTGWSSCSSGSLLHLKYGDLGRIEPGTTIQVLVQGVFNPNFAGDVIFSAVSWSNGGEIIDEGYALSSVEAANSLDLVVSFSSSFAGSESTMNLSVSTQVPLPTNYSINIFLPEGSSFVSTDARLMSTGVLSSLHVLSSHSVRVNLQLAGADKILLSFGSIRHRSWSGTAMLRVSTSISEDVIVELGTHWYILAPATVHPVAVHSRPVAGGIGTLNVDFTSYNEIPGPLAVGDGAYVEIKFPVNVEVLPPLAAGFVRGLTGSVTLDSYLTDTGSHRVMILKRVGNGSATPAGSVISIAVGNVRLPAFSGVTAPIAVMVKTADGLGIDSGSASGLEVSPGILQCANLSWQSTVRSGMVGLKAIVRICLQNSVPDGSWVSVALHNENEVYQALPGGSHLSGRELEVMVSGLVSPPLSGSLIAQISTLRPDKATVIDSASTFIEIQPAIGHCSVGFSPNMSGVTTVVVLNVTFPNILPANGRLRVYLPTGYSVTPMSSVHVEVGSYSSLGTTNPFNGSLVADFTFSSPVVAGSLVTVRIRDVTHRRYGGNVDWRIVSLADSSGDDIVDEASVSTLLKPAVSSSQITTTNSIAGSVTSVQLSIVVSEWLGNSTQYVLSFPLGWNIGQASAVISTQSRVYNASVAHQDRSMSVLFPGLPQDEGSVSISLSGVILQDWASSEELCLQVASLDSALLAEVGVESAFEAVEMGLVVDIGCSPLTTVGPAMLKSSVIGSPRVQGTEWNARVEFLSDVEIPSDATFTVLFPWSLTAVPFVRVVPNGCFDGTIFSSLSTDRKLNVQRSGDGSNVRAKCKIELGLSLTLPSFSSCSLQESAITESFGAVNESTFAESPLHPFLDKLCANTTLHVDVTGADSRLHARGDLNFGRVWPKGLSEIQLDHAGAVAGSNEELLLRFVISSSLVSDAYIFVSLSSGHSKCEATGVVSTVVSGLDGALTVANFSSGGITLVRNGGSTVVGGTSVTLALHGIVRVPGSGSRGWHTIVTTDSSFRILDACSVAPLALLPGPLDVVDVTTSIQGSGGIGSFSFNLSFSNELSSSGVVVVKFGKDWAPATDGNVAWTVNGQYGSMGQWVSSHSSIILRNMSLFFPGYSIAPKTLLRISLLNMKAPPFSGNSGLFSVWTADSRLLARSVGCTSCVAGQSSCAEGGAEEAISSMAIGCFDSCRSDSSLDEVFLAGNLPVTSSRLLNSSVQVGTVDLGAGVVGPDLIAGSLKEHIVSMETTFAGACGSISAEFTLSNSLPAGGGVVLVAPAGWTWQCGSWLNCVNFTGGFVVSSAVVSGRSVLLVVSSSSVAGSHISVIVNGLCSPQVPVESAKLGLVTVSNLSTSLGFEENGGTECGADDCEMIPSLCRSVKFSAVCDAELFNRGSCSSCVVHGSRLIDEVSVVLATQSAHLESTRVSSSSILSRVGTEIRVEATLTNSLPAGGHVQMTFPDGYNVSGTSLISAEGLSVSTISVEGNTVTLLNVDDVVRGTRISISLSGVVNRVWRGISEVVSVATRANNGAVIDFATAYLPGLTEQYIMTADDSDLLSFSARNPSEGNSLGSLPSPMLALGVSAVDPVSKELFLAGSDELFVVRVANFSQIISRTLTAGAMMVGGVGAFEWDAAFSGLVTLMVLDGELAVCRVDPATGNVTLVVQLPLCSFPECRAIQGVSAFDPRSRTLVLSSRMYLYLVDIEAAEVRTLILDHQRRPGAGITSLEWDEGQSRLLALFVEQDGHYVLTSVDIHTGASEDVATFFDVDSGGVVSTGVSTFFAKTREYFVVSKSRLVSANADSGLITHYARAFAGRNAATWSFLAIQEYVST